MKDKNSILNWKRFQRRVKLKSEKYFDANIQQSSLLIEERFPSLLLIFVMANIPELSLVTNRFGDTSLVY
ncbi:hypothetical protein T05_6313 [Trichinella murrelli]|uniref:Uncharacterized protein n=1 Tax=Trichinella murrelli TaxID=144512 RepID=A0A0V0TAY5_9BILA|nr:hypothetical protein T05_6313 [Trichinella murrelli]